MGVIAPTSRRKGASLGGRQHQTTPDGKCAVWGEPDGAVTIDDLLYFLAIYEAGTTAADVDDGSSTGTPDGAVTIDDLLYLLARYEAGC